MACRRRNWLQQAVDACAGFVVLVGRDGVARWVGALRVARSSASRPTGSIGDCLRPAEGDPGRAGLLRHAARTRGGAMAGDNGNSGCGKSSLMNAGLLPLVDRAGCGPRPTSRLAPGRADNVRRPPGGDAARAARPDLRRRDGRASSRGGRPHTSLEAALAAACALPQKRPPLR